MHVCFCQINQTKSNHVTVTEFITTSTPDHIHDTDLNLVTQTGQLLCSCEASELAYIHIT